MSPSRFIKAQYFPTFTFNPRPQPWGGNKKLVRQCSGSQRPNCVHTPVAERWHSVACLNILWFFRGNRVTHTWPTFPEIPYINVTNERPKQAHFNPSHRRAGRTPHHTTIRQPGLRHYTTTASKQKLTHAPPTGDAKKWPTTGMAAPHRHHTMKLLLRN